MPETLPLKHQSERAPLLSRVSPVVTAIALLVFIIALIGPWSNLPINDDWQYAHLSKSLAERGTFPIDTSYESKTVIGQAAFAWPIIHVFGFSHLALRLLTLGISILMLVEIDYLLFGGGVSAGVRFIALCVIVVNPFFLHFSTAFMTENYAYFVALLAGCVWFFGRRRDSAWLPVIAGVIAGLAFWIRQFSALVFPALLVAEFVVARAERRSLSSLLRRRMPAIGAWASMILAYFVWASRFDVPLPRLTHSIAAILTPPPVVIFIEAGVFLFYVSFFFAPFLAASARWQRPSVTALIPIAILIITAGFAWRHGNRTGLPTANLRYVFPFLRNVFTGYGVGPITLTDVYIQNAQTRPRVPTSLWIAIEAAIIPLALSWEWLFANRAARAKEITVFGISFALMCVAAAVLYFREGIFDRYLYPGILGFVIAVPMLFSKQNETRLYRFGLPCLAAMAFFSAFSIHDYFRWNEVRARLVMESTRFGIARAQLDAGLELNAWNSVEEHGMSPGCDGRVNWFCTKRPYEIGLEQTSAKRVLLSLPVDSWLIPFPSLKLMTRAR